MLHVVVYIFWLLCAGSKVGLGFKREGCFNCQNFPFGVFRVVEFLDVGVDRKVSSNAIVTRYQSPTFLNRPTSKTCSLSRL